MLSRPRFLRWRRVPERGNDYPLGEPLEPVLVWGRRILDVFQTLRLAGAALRDVATQRPWLRSLVVLGLLGAGTWATWRTIRLAPQAKALPTLDRFNTIQDGPYDVIVVGGGPAGIACAYWLASGGKRVALLERDARRPTMCGNVLTTRCQDLLNDMGIMHTLRVHPEAKWVNTLAMIAPSGRSFVSKLVKSRPLSLPRHALLQQMTAAACDAGVSVFDDVNVTRIRFNEIDELWTIGGDHTSYRATMLVAADGAASLIGRSLGIVKDTATMCCGSCRATSSTDPPVDSFAVFPSSMVPGNVSFTRHVDNSWTIFCTIPAESNASLESIQSTYATLLAEDEHIRAALGPDPEVGPLEVDLMRVGGVGNSVGNHVVLVGDAAGHADPLCGFGLRYGLEGAKMAAETIVEAFIERRFDAAFLQRYDDRWRRAFRSDFYIAALMAKMLRKYPGLVDAIVHVIQRRGSFFAATCVDLWHCNGPKWRIFNPGIGAVVIIEALRQWVRPVWAAIVPWAARASPSPSPTPSALFTSQRSTSPSHQGEEPLTMHILSPPPFPLTQPQDSPLHPYDPLLGQVAHEPRSASSPL